MVRSSKELLGKVLGSCTLEQLLGQGGWEQSILHDRNALHVMLQ